VIFPVSGLGYMFRPEQPPRGYLPLLALKLLARLKLLEAEIAL